MLPLQLPFSVALVVVALISAVALWFSKPRSVKLDTDGEYEPLAGAEEETTHRDAFDILEPEDTIDGHPIAPARFWKQMQLVKFALYAHMEHRRLRAELTDFVRS